MLQITIRTKGIQELIAKNEKAMKAIEKGEFTDALQKKIVRRAKYRAPRDKGKLVAAIKGKKVNAYAFKIICDAVNKRGQPYPQFLELGTRFIKVGKPETPRVIKSPYRSKGGSGKTAYLPFIQWAVWRTLQEAPKIFKDKILKFYN